MIGFFAWQNFNPIGICTNTKYTPRKKSSLISREKVQPRNKSQKNYLKKVCFTMILPSSKILKILCMHIMVTNSEKFFIFFVVLKLAGISFALNFRNQWCVHLENRIKSSFQASSFFVLTTTSISYTRFFVQRKRSLKSLL